MELEVGTVMEFILEHKWTFLIAAEVIFWLSIISFITIRYWFKLYKVSWLFFGLFLVNDLWIATMGYFDYLETGEFSSYQIIIVVILVYALTYGKTDMKRLDGYIQRKVATWKGESAPPKADSPKLYGAEHAKQERKDFLKHVMIFLTLNALFWVFFGLSEATTQLSDIKAFITHWFENDKALLPYTNTSVNQIIRVWSIILVADGLFSLSYTVFPKKRKMSA